MRIPIPLIMAAALFMGAVTSFLVQVNILALGSWDSRYAAFNGTHVYQTASMITTTYKTLYLGYGTAYFKKAVNVYYLDKVKSGAVGGTADLGRFLPIRIYIDSGTLPTNTYITWTDPLSGTTRALYFVAGTNRGYVIGVYYSSSTTKVAVAIPVYYVVEGSQVRLYPMEKAAVQTTEACGTVLKNINLGASSTEVYAILDNQYYSCSAKKWASVTVGWVQVASSATTASLYPFPNYYQVKVTSGSSSLTIFLSYWYAVNTDPTFFAVKPG